MYNEFEINSLLLFVGRVFTRLFVIYSNLFVDYILLVFRASATILGFWLSFILIAIFVFVFNVIQDFLGCTKHAEYKCCRILFGFVSPYSLSLFVPLSSTPPLLPRILSNFSYLPHTLQCPPSLWKLGTLVLLIICILSYSFQFMAFSFYRLQLNCTASFPARSFYIYHNSCVNVHVG